MTLTTGTDFLETDRLVLRRITADDVDFFARIHADPEVAQYISHGRPRAVEETRAWLESTLSGYQALALGQLAVVRRSDGTLLGRCGLSDLAVEVSNTEDRVRRCWWSRAQIPTGTSVTFDHELGYTFDRACWGHGYASEAVSRVFSHVRDAAQISRIISLIHPDNARSLKLARRFGAVLEGRVESVGRVLNTFVWPA
jgi:[ribosomal protein S5]-alanine N-acetyltransferase